MRWPGLTKPVKQFEKAFDCKVGHTSEDGLATLEFVECHADCGKAPVVMVGEDEYTNVGVEQATELAGKMKAGEL